jgi:hypothetical protein
MQTPVQYEQIGTSALYEVPQHGAAGWAAYVVPGTARPPSIGLGESFDSFDGYYLFAVSRPAEVDRDPEAFAEQALAYFRAGANFHRGVAWLAGVAPAAFGPFAEFGFAWSKDMFGTQLRSNLNVGLGRTLNFFVLRGLFIRMDEASASLVVSLKRGTQEFIGFQRGRSLIGITVSPGDRQEARIAVAGPNTASFVFTVRLTPAVTFAASGLEVGGKYFLRDRTLGTDTRIDYPALDVGALPVTLAGVGVVDPSDPFNAVLGTEALEAGALRTGFGLAGTAALASQFRTAQGTPLALLPVGTDVSAVALPLAAGALALASAAPAEAQIKDGVAYLALAGQFGLALGPKSTTEDLLCGIFGSERLTFVTSVAGGTLGDVLRWIPSQPAYAPVFPFDTATLEAPDSGGVRPRIEPRYRSSWATMVAADQPVLYRAEPEGSPLYGAPDAAKLLSSTPPRLPVSGAPQDAFPLVPYAGVRPQAGVTGDMITGFESQILSPTRRTIISRGATPAWQARAASTRAAAGPTTSSTTPQGLVVTIDPASGAYHRVLLAQSPDDAGALLPFAFDRPTVEVQQALQTNQLFLVAVTPAPFVDPARGATFANVVDLAGWTMTADVGRGATPTSYRNVLIMKFCSGSVVERVTNPNRWTDPEVFSLIEGTGGAGADLAYTGLSQWLQDYLAAALALAGGPAAPFYQRFKQVVTDPAWNGVLVLAADLSAGDLPPQIRGLAAGIDLTRFASHHFGFTASRVTVDPKTGQIAIDGPSSWFGLVDYMDATYAQNVAGGGNPEVPIPVMVEGDFGFTVLELRSLFENTALTRFESRVQLTNRRLFGSSVAKAYSRGQEMPETAVVLAGSYIDQGGDGIYVFEQRNPSVFVTDSNTLRAVAFNRVQFNTLGERDGGATVASRFLIWGAFDFAELHANDGTLLDVCSFGSPTDTPPNQLGVGLAFSNLVIGMAFPIATPNATVFTLDTDNLAYDLAASSARPGSLFKGFGLQLKSFVNAAGAQTPADLGFLPVSSSLRLKRLAGPWFGVVYEVTLGGPGALASAAGFSSNLLVAWGPKALAADAAREVFLGLSLPGAAPGAKLFSIQGVFKVAVGAIALQRQVVPDTGQDGQVDTRYYYCLRLDDIAVKIFGIAKLPPSATIRFFLFGDPDTTGSLAWYAAYVANQPTLGAARGAIDREGSQLVIEEVRP